MLLERPAELLHRGEPRVARGILAIDLLDQHLGFLDLVHVGRLPGRERRIALGLPRDGAVEVLLFHLLVHLELGAKLPPQRAPPGRGCGLDLLERRLRLAVLLFQ